jgi:hypothetical protein
MWRVCENTEKKTHSKWHKINKDLNTFCHGEKTDEKAIILYTKVDVKRFCLNKNCDTNREARVNTGHTTNATHGHRID